MTARVATVVVVLVVGLAGCTTNPTGPRELVPSSAPPPPAQERPKDRSREALLTALRGIDLCAVLDALSTAKPTTLAPFTCTVGDQFDGLSATVVGFDHSSRVTLPTRSIGGVKAYVKEASTRCSVYLPVSFTWAVEFSQNTSCQAVVTASAAAVPVLTDPAQARVDPWWDGCTALAEVLELGAGEPKLVGARLADCAYFAPEREKQASLAFTEPESRWGKSRPASVGSTRVQLFQDGENCGVYWRQGAFASSFARKPDYPVFLATSSCDHTTELTESAIGILAAPPPTGITAQDPLLYSPSEPDGPYLGACAYLEDETEARTCEPYRETPVPDDLTNSYNAQVMCAASVDAVREHFGARPRPVAESDNGESCHFVEPERTAVLTFVVRGGRVGSGPDGRQVSVEGHPGFLEADGRSVHYRVSTTDDVDRDGAVEFIVRTGPAVAPDTSLPPGTEARAEAVLADILETYFP